MAAVHALWRLEEGSKSQGGHFDQGGVAFQVVLSIIIISSPAFESSSSSSPLTYVSSLDVQALPREVKEDYTERAILAMHNDLLEEKEKEKEVNAEKQ